MQLPFRPQSVGSLRRAGYEAGAQDVIEAFAAEAERVYGAVRVKLDEKTLRLAIAASQHVGFASISARSGI
jgi:octanoyl-[GcvH]:protein N-octanoyltransferase